MGRSNIPTSGKVRLTMLCTIYHPFMLAQSQRGLPFLKHSQFPSPSVLDISLIQSFWKLKIHRCNAFVFVFCFGVFLLAASYNSTGGFFYSLSRSIGNVHMKGGGMHTQKNSFVDFAIQQLDYEQTKEREENKRIAKKRRRGEKGRKALKWNGSAHWLSFKPTSQTDQCVISSFGSERHFSFLETAKSTAITPPNKKVATRLLTGVKRGRSKEGIIEKGLDLDEPLSGRRKGGCAEQVSKVEKNDATQKKLVWLVGDLGAKMKIATSRVTLRPQSEGEKGSLGHPNH